MLRAYLKVPHVIPRARGDILRQLLIDIGGWWIRSWRPTDVTALLKYADNRNIWLNLRDRFPNPYREEDAQQWIERANAPQSGLTYAIASNEEAIGGIGLQLQHDVHRRSAEMGYWLGEPFCGQGIATKALTALTEYAFANFDLVRLYPTVFEWNPASVRVLEKAGYAYEGRLRKSVTKDGKTIDQLWYAIVRE